MGYKPKKLGHVNIFVRNAERARDWYADLLGLHTYGFKAGFGAFMTSDMGNSHEIALMEAGEEAFVASDNFTMAQRAKRGQVGLNHISWYMESLEDLAEIYHRVKERNIPIDEVNDHGHSVGIYIHDPDGNGIELTYELPRSQWGGDEENYQIGTSPHGRFQGPWEAEMIKGALAQN